MHQQALFVSLSPSKDLSNHLQSVLYFKGGFFKHRDTICIEMFYSELLLRECSEAGLGEGAWNPLQRHKGIGYRSGASPPTSSPLASESPEEGPQMLTLLFKDLSKIMEKEENMRL